MAKAKSKRGRKRKRRSKGLSGIETVIAPTQIKNGELSVGQLGIGLLALAGGNVVGSILLGSHALIPSAVALGVGIMRKNIYWTMAGAGMFLANGYQSKTPTSTQPGTSGVDEGLDLANLDKIKERAKNYLSTFAEKLYLPAPNMDAAVNGMNGEDGKDEVSYYMNPFAPNKGQLDLRELDKIQANIAQMSGTAEDMDASEMNY